MNVFQEIKDRITCVEYAKSLGWNIYKSGDRTFSLDKGENQTCLVVFDDFWHDYKTGIGGDIIDLSAVVKHDGDKSDALRELCELTGIQPTQQSKQWFNYTQNLCNTIQLWHTQLRQEDYDYLHDRSITDETIIRLKIGFNQNQNRIVIPYFKNGYVSYWIGRTTDNNKIKYLKPKLDGMNENTLWGLHTLKREQKELFITEGAFDAVTLDQENKSVIATMGGFFSREQLKQLYLICFNFTEVILCLDGDKTGQENTMKLAKSFLSKKINFSCVDLKKYKDVSDYYVANKNLNFIEDRINGLKYITSKLTTKEEFKDFIKSIARFTSKTLLIDLFDLVKETYPKQWLQTLKLQAMSCPTEYMMIKELSSKHKIKYHPQIGFFEYQNGFWKRKEDETIQFYIHNELGYYSTGSKVNSICKLLKATASTETLFNKQPVINFQNGVLHTETGEFRPHSESYLTTVQMSYDYDPEAEPDKWLKFLKDITNKDKDKMELIQQMFGYILFEDCALQKGFFLIGNGADGKSKLLEIVSLLFGNENVSSVEMSCLAEPFRCISLLDSFVNISSETATNVKIASEIFKQIITGDPIDACYKNKNFIKFTTRAKMIIATNEQINTYDSSFGMERRPIFIQFPMHFCDNPIYDNEMKADRYIIDKLKPELSAIFNWTYEGYKALKISLKFKETAEQEEIREEFRELNNPVYNFMNDYLKNEKILTSNIFTNDLYQDYKIWCKENGRMQMSLIGFSRKLKNTMESYYRDRFEYFRTNKQKGYKILSSF